MRLSCPGGIDCTAFVPIFYKCFGANVSKKSMVHMMGIMNPWEADLITLAPYVWTSNCLLSPKRLGTDTYEEIVCEKHTFVGLKAVVTGGTHLEKHSSVATLTTCSQSLKAGQRLIGKHLLSTKLPEGLEPPEMEHNLVRMIFLDMGIRTLVLGSFILSFIPAVVMGGFIFNLLQPLGYFVAVSFAVTFAVPLVVVFVGVIYVRTNQHYFMGYEVGKRASMDEMYWGHYLQGCYLAQWLSLAFVNGSWLCSLLHRCCGAKCALDSTWLSFNIRDHQNLTVESGAVIDRCGYFVGHSHEVGSAAEKATTKLNLKAEPVEDDGSMFFMRKSSVGKNGVIHPYGIILGGGSVKDLASLDCNSHSHIEASITRAEHWSGSPAKKADKSRLCQLRAGTIDC